MHQSGNNFGLMRLTFAALVIVSHSFELIDGNRTREPLTQVFGTFSIAEIAVAGFFIVSGYLITQSYTASRTSSEYLLKRILRIYPAYVAASAFCIVVVGPLAGASLAALSVKDWAIIAMRCLALQVPKLPNAFAGQYYPSLNGSMWTIAYEFRCYLVLIILGYLGWLRNTIVLSLSLVLWAMVVFLPNSWQAGRIEPLIGSLDETIRLTALFLTGVSFFLFRQQIAYRNSYAALAAMGLVALLFHQQIAGPAVAFLGGYLVFWFAFLPGTPVLNSINSKTDLSYGVYLYAWPIQMLLIRYLAGISPGAVISLTAIGATLLAFVSWTAIEKPMLYYKRSLRRAA